ncbi:Domain of unknown function DUF676, lipase-like [uncultured Caudovirales phage]|uniref:DUF676 domain-containing protein n=1 Tax=uncultured Caudovirales phage TaxID=2100421 RepID=A0A6J5L7G1_9CAUD|nr:Domain of unknown function DUF676, lipase-like [uncultured Caudovirales phage]
MVFSDLIKIFKNITYLGQVLDSSEVADREFRNRFSEETYLLEPCPNIAMLLAYVALGKPLQRDSLAGAFTVGESKHKEKHPKEVWFFVNGICTDANLAKLNGACLSELFSRKIQVIHNPTFGIIPDLAECIFERTFDGFAPITAHLYNEVISAMAKKQKVVIIGHSQGGIITESLLKLFNINNIKCSNIEVYNFASAADEDLVVPGVYQEHFANENDFVSRVGILTATPQHPVFVKESGAGHLLNRDYLEHFMLGKYCNKKSRLFGYLNK